MKIRRITTAEGGKGVVTQIDEILDTAQRTSLDMLNIWGFDKVPGLPLGPEQVLGEYQQKGAFGPLGGLRADLFVIPPMPGEYPPDLGESVGKLDMGTGGGMVPHPAGHGMHRTDTVDLIVVVEGSLNIAYPDEDGDVYEVTVNAGDFITHNGTFHRWHNRSNEMCTVVIITIAAERQAS